MRGLHVVAAQRDDPEVLQRRRVVRIVLQYVLKLLIRLVDLSLIRERDAVGVQSIGVVAFSERRQDFHGFVRFAGLGQQKTELHADALVLPAGANRFAKARDRVADALALLPDKREQLVTGGHLRPRRNHFARE